MTDTLFVCSVCSAAKPRAEVTVVHPQPSRTREVPSYVLGIACKTHENSDALAQEAADRAVDEILEAAWN